MNEETKDLFAEMFGEQKKEEVVSKPETTSGTEPIVEKDDDADGMTERPDLEAERIETEEKCEAKDEKKDEECVEQKVLDEAKKELGIGGAAFCDELFAQCPEVFQKLKDAKKTLSGFFNFAYSYALDEYVKKNGKKNGGCYWDLHVLAEKYLDPSVREGFTVKEPKVKPPKPSAKAESPAKTVAKVAKRAASAAKKEAKAEKPKQEDRPIDPKKVIDAFADIDMSAL